MKTILILALCMMCVTTAFAVTESDSPSRAAFLANAWTCLDRDIPADTKVPSREVVRKDFRFLLERMGRFSQVLDAEVKASERAKDPNARSSLRRSARETLATLEVDMRKVPDFGKKGIPSLETDASMDLFVRAIQELESIRKRIAE